MQILLRASLILLILIVGVAIAIILYKRYRPLRNAHFICPHCGSITAPNRLMLAVSPARADNYLLPCASCGRFGYMQPVWDTP